MSERTWKITLNENELKALIEYHAIKHSVSSNFDVERSARIHDLTKRLNRKDDEVNQEQPANAPASDNEQKQIEQQLTISKALPSGW